MNEKQNMTRPDWRPYIVILVVCSTVFSLFATIPIYPDITQALIRGLSAYKRDGNSKETDLTKQLSKLDVNYKVRHLQKLGELVDFYSRYTNNHEIAQVIIEESLEQNLPINIAFALAWRESQFNPRAVSPPNKGGSIDWGLFQLNDGHRKNWTPSEFFDIRKNAHEALVYLKYCMQEMGDIKLALAAYNSGLWGVRKRGVPPVTKRYVDSIIAYEKKLELDFALYPLKKINPPQNRGKYR